VLCTYEELRSAESFGRGMDGKAGRGVSIIDVLDKLAVSLVGVDPLLDEEDFLLPFNDRNHCICESKFWNILYWQSSFFLNFSSDKLVSEIQQ